MYRLFLQISRKRTHFCAPKLCQIFLCQFWLITLEFFQDFTVCPGLLVRKTKFDIHSSTEFSSAIMNVFLNH